MNPHLQKLIPHPSQPKFATVGRFPNRKWFWIPLAPPALALALVSCSSSDSPPPPPPPSVPITDTRPVGEGLKLIGFAVLGAAVVTVLGKLIR